MRVLRLGDRLGIVANAKRATVTTRRDMRPSVPLVVTVRLYPWGKTGLKRSALRDCVDCRTDRPTDYQHFIMTFSSSTVVQAPKTTRFARHTVSYWTSPNEDRRSEWCSRQQLLHLARITCRIGVVLCNVSLLCCCTSLSGGLLPNREPSLHRLSLANWDYFFYILMTTPNII